MDLLRSMRYDDQPKKRIRRKKIAVEAGLSVKGIVTGSSSEEGEDTSIQYDDTDEDNEVEKLTEEDVAERMEDELDEVTAVDEEFELKPGSFNQNLRKDGSSYQNISSVNTIESVTRLATGQTITETLYVSARYLKYIST